MENKAHALAAGIFVVVVAALLLALGAWLTRESGTYHHYEISTRESITGLQEQAPVRFRGVDVGKVDAIGFDPKVPGNVLVKLSVEPRAPLTGDTFATLGVQGVTGLSFVQLDDSGKPAARLEPNDEAPPRIPFRPGLLSKLTERGEVILDQVEQMTKRLNNMLAQPNQQRIAGALEQVGQAAQSITQLSSRTVAILDAQLGPQRVSIPQAVQGIQTAVDSLRRTSDEARSALNDVGGMARELNAPGGPVQRLGQGAAALSQAAERFNVSTLPRINQVADETARAARQLQRTVGGIDENPQSLIFGPARGQPGPGEPGFVEPGEER